jgi:hypothetical protein
VRIQLILTNDELVSVVRVFETDGSLIEGRLRLIGVAD